MRSSLLRAGIPVCVTLAGGYAERIEDTVAINLATLARLCVNAIEPRQVPAVERRQAGVLDLVDDARHAAVDEPVAHRAGHGRADVAP